MILMKCQCGQITEESCDAEAEVLYTYVPASRLDTAKRLRSTRGLTETIQVSRACAKLLAYEAEVLA